MGAGGSGSVRREAKAGSSQELSTVGPIRIDGGLLRSKSSAHRGTKTGNCIKKCRQMIKNYMYIQTHKLLKG